MDQQQIEWLEKRIEQRRVLFDLVRKLLGELEESGESAKIEIELHGNKVEGIDIAPMGFQRTHRFDLPEVAPKSHGS